jgi:hypothetical protein
MGFFEGFSRRPEADSEAWQKRDSATDLWVAAVRIFLAVGPTG